MRQNLTSGRTALVSSLLLPPAVCAVLLPARGSLANTDVALGLVVVIVAVASLGHRVPGALTAVSAAVWFDFFFTRPYATFDISKSADLTTAVLLLLVGLAVSQLATHARRMRVIAITDAGYLAQIHDTAVLSRSANSPLAVADHVREQLIEVLQLRGCRFEYGTLMGHPPRLEHDGSVLIGENVWDVDRLGMPAQEVELRLVSSDRYYGRFMLDPIPGARPSRQARLVAATLADQAGAALDPMWRVDKAA
ncbi:DUF4118 domain-containing protein [Kitasatospora sp. NPDC052896]|uniref:DUF4118 domain-containing protein n=1 Tax=Kitasatospora sp. NPDC052896 TaxID=3364061 RepID=UPI0037CB93B1